MAWPRGGNELAHRSVFIEGRGVFELAHSSAVMEVGLAHRQEVLGAGGNALAHHSAVMEGRG